MGKTIRAFRYDQNQIPYDYTAEVTKTFKGLDLIECQMELWMEVHDIAQEDRNQDHAQEKGMQKSKMAV